jgi:hypothetical protein
MSCRRYWAAPRMAKMKNARSPEAVGVRLEVALLFVLMVVPLAIGLAWGPYLDDGAYSTFRRARDLLSDGIGGWVADPSLYESPLFVLALTLLAKLGIPLQQAALILSTLGWGAAAVAVHRVGRTLGRSIAAVAAATLVVLNPIVVSTLGTGASWTVAMVGIVIAAMVGKRWRAQAVALMLMLGTHLGLSTLVLSVLVLVIQWVHQGRFPLQSSLVLGILLLLGWGLPAVLYHVTAPIHFSLSIGHWQSAVQRLLSESEFYWLFLPPLLCGVWGLLATGGNAWQAGLPWCAWAALAVLDGSKTAEAILVTLGLLLVGLGINSVIARQWSPSWPCPGIFPCAALSVQTGGPASAGADSGRLGAFS